MTREEELHERARRHGLVREEADIGTGWSMPKSHSYLVGRAYAGWWWWAPHGPDNFVIDRLPRYKTEGGALAAALDWLDEQEPSKAWRSSPGAKLGEAVTLLRGLRVSIEELGRLMSGLMGTRSKNEPALDKAIELLQSLALPPASDEGEVLTVALEYLLHLGVLPASARPAFVETLRQHPEALEGLPIAGPWRYDAVCNDWRRHALDGRVVCRAWRSTRRDDPPAAWASAYLEESGTVWVSQAAALGGVDNHARYPGRWVLVGGVPEALAPPALEAETAPGDTRGEACAACGGIGEVVAPSSRYGAASRCNDCGGTGRAT